MKTNAACPHRGMRSRVIAPSWEQGFPTGNGTLGALVYGGPSAHTVLINHERLFLPLPENSAPFIPDMADCLPRARQMLREGRSGEASRYWRDMMIERGFPEALVWTDPFHPAFQLEIGMPAADLIEDYLRELDFETGEVRISWRDARGGCLIRFFVSRTDGALVMSIRRPAGRLSCSIALRETPGRQHIMNVETGCANGWITFHSLYEAGDGGYRGAARVVGRGGCAESSEAGVHIRDAGEAVILASVDVFGHAEDRGASALQKRLSRLASNYDRHLHRQEKAHGALFGRVSLDLAAAEERAETNEELLSRARSGNAPLALIERAFDFGRFALIASSGQLPPNLQGVWNGTWSPPWSSDYTLDENLQMMMWQALPGGLFEAAETCFSLIEGYLEDWRANARTYYGCRGILSSARSSRSGLHRHLSVEYPLQFWTAGAGWFGQLYWDYWLFTGDRRFLAGRAVPYLKQAAAFYLDFICRNPEGALEFNPSYSPENTPGNRDNAASINATMDIAVAREVLSHLIEACGILGRTEPDMGKWRALLGELPSYRINADGALAEWAHPNFDDAYRHRHSSHLYPVFPGFEASGEQTPGLFAACRRAAELRLTDGIEAITGWGLAHLANTAARVKDGGLADAAVSRILAFFMMDNLFTTHNKRELFQLDANMGLSAAIMEMLVYSTPGRLELLPALPARMARGEIRGLRCRGCVRLERMAWDFERATLSFSIHSEEDQTVSVRLPRPIARVVEQPPRIGFRIARPEARSVELSLRAGRSAAATLELR
jgi:alpha-L-fucosidase 2